MQITHRFHRVARLSVLTSVLSIALLLTACGGSSSDPTPTPTPTPTPDPTAVGYYTGTASVMADNNTTPLPVDDLQGIFDGTQFKFMSEANDLIYDGTITSQTGDDFTADVTIYKYGYDPYTATVSGTITEGSRITGTATGTKAGNGDFTLTYALSNSETASISKITKTFSDPVNVTSSGIALSVDSGGNFQPVSAGADTSIFQFCTVVADSNSKITPIDLSNIYSISVKLDACKNSFVDGVYTGLAATKSTTNADDTLVLIVTNGTYGLAGDFGP